MVVHRPPAKGNQDSLTSQSGGTLTETSATVNVLSGTYGGLMTFAGNGGTYSITGVLTNDGTLALNGSAVSPAYILHGGTIGGGTITTPLGVQSWGDYFGKLTDRFGVQWMLNCPLRSRGAEP